MIALPKENIILLYNVFFIETIRLCVCINKCTFLRRTSYESMPINYTRY